MVALLANSGDPDQMLHSVVSDLGLHSLSVTHLGISSLLSSVIRQTFQRESSLTKLQRKIFSFDKTPDKMTF